MKRILTLVIVLCMAVTMLSGCGPKEKDPVSQVTDAPTPEITAQLPDESEVPTAEPQETGTPEPQETAEQTDEPTGEPTEEVTEEPSETPGEDVTEEPTQPSETDVPATGVPDEGGPESAANVTFDKSKVLNFFTNPNAVTKAVVEENGQYLVKISSTGSTNDPFIMFNYKGYVQEFGFSPVSANEYKYVVIKIRQENCSNNTFELFYCAGGITGATPNYSRTKVFNNADDSVQYVVFDLSTANGWNGTVNAFRFDYEQMAASSGEAIYVYAVMLFKTQDDMKDFLPGAQGGDPNALTEAQQQQAEALINSAKEVAPAVSNNKLTAAHEDSSISLWFNHSYVKTPEASTKSSGMNTYQIRMAKNEIEGVQFLLAATSAKTGLTAELSDFTDSSGNKLKHVICEGYYFDDVEGQNIVDPIPELKGSFDLKAGKSKTFLIKVYTEAGTKAGQYSAVLRIKDGAGNEIKKANVYVYVWNFALPDACSCKIQADLSWWNIYAGNPPWTYYGDDGVAYARYYEYLLENKVNCYNMPYLNTEGDNPFTDSRVNKYLNDPRVQCFNPVGYGKFSQVRAQNAYNYLSQNPEWLEKAYFYPVDEPQTTAQLNEVISAANIIKSIFGSNYKLICPMHINRALTSANDSDFFSYVASAVNVWCPHNYFFTTFADFSANPLLMYQYYSAKLEANLGTFKDRMAAEQAQGDEVWWYVTRFPHNPEITLSIDDQEVVHRIMFWQQKLYNIDGFLYYLVNDWHYGAFPWNKLHETNNSYPYNVYGNGVLVYNGFEDAYGNPYTGSEGFDEMEDKSFNAYPVGSLRLESVRDGAEDYDYFTILDSLYGEGTSELIIKQITTSLGTYEADDELFNRLRIVVGNLIAAKK